MNLNQQLRRAETMASFYTKQLEDYDGIVLRTSYTEPEDKFWLVEQIQRDLDECLRLVDVYRKALGITITPCPNHEGNYDCHSFCPLCQGEQELTTIKGDR